MKKILRIFSMVILGFGSTHAGDLFSISLDYCDTTESILQYHLEPGVETGICYNISNHSDTSTTIKISFIDGTFTNDELRNKACLTDGDINNFGKYVTGYEQFITLKAGETIKKDAKILYPKGIDGIYYGCIVYSVIGDTGENQPNITGFSVLMRRARFIDITVGNPKNIEENNITGSDEKNILTNIKSIVDEKISSGIGNIMRYLSVIGIIILIFILIFLTRHKKRRHKEIIHHHNIHHHPHHNK